MMRRTILAFVIAALVLAPAAATVLASVPATSAGDGCVTRAEFRRVHEGMRQARVRQIFDTAGQLSLREGDWEQYAYPGCDRWVTVWVEYTDNEVTSKDWVRGE